MRKLFFTILLVVVVLVTIRLYNQKEAQNAESLAAAEILLKDQAILPETESENTNVSDIDETSAEFKEEHPEITAGDEETLIDD